jgi:hypothetical protein
LMRFRRFKQMLAWILALSVLVSMMFVSTAFADDGKQGLTLREKFGDKTTSGYKIDFYEDNIIYYWDVLAEYADKGYQPTEGITIEIPAAENFKSSIPVDQVPIWDELGGKKGKFLIWENDVQWMEWTFEVETPGLYNIEVDYYPLVDSKSSVARDVLIDGVETFTEMKGIWGLQYAFVRKKTSYQKGTDVWKEFDEIIDFDFGFGCFEPESDHEVDLCIKEAADKGIKGLSIAAPLQYRAFQSTDLLSEEAMKTGLADTVRIENGVSVGYNTFLWNMY